MELFKIKNYINGELQSPFNNLFIENINPSVGLPYSLVPDSDDVDAIAAIEAAQKAFVGWKNTKTEVRAEFLKKIALKIEEKISEFAKAESCDNGKPLWLAETIDIPRSIQNLRFFAEAIGQYASECYPLDNEGISFTLKQPLGVVTCISPWNLPLYLLTWKIAPALAAGNTVVAKPSEVTPMTAYLLSKVCIEVGLPPGVLNIIHGQGSRLGNTLCTHSNIKAVSFTGSTQTGRTIAQATAPHFKKVSLEMGGKNATVVFADADLEKALDATVRGAFTNQGQICLCGSRILIDAKIYEEFKNKLVERTKSLKVGNPLDMNSQQGALVSKIHFEKVLASIEMAKQEGGRILTGGERFYLQPPFDNGYYIAPTIIEGLSMECKTNQEEIFGPVATITSFQTKEEALSMANATRYGLAGSVWTSNIETAQYFIKNIESGLFWINTWMLRDLRTPFGGVKESGVGREGGVEALRFFTEQKNICWKY